MSLFDDLQKEVAKRNPCAEKRDQIEELRKKTHEALNALFLMNSTDNEQMAFLKGQLAGFDACLDLFVDETEREHQAKEEQWEEEET